MNYPLLQVVLKYYYVKLPEWGIFLNDLPRDDSLKDVNIIAIIDQWEVILLMKLYIFMN